MITASLVTEQIGWEGGREEEGILSVVMSLTTGGQRIVGDNQGRLDHTGSPPWQTGRWGWAATLGEQDAGNKAKAESWALIPGRKTSPDFWWAIRLHPLKLSSTKSTLESTIQSCLFLAQKPSAHPHPLPSLHLHSLPTPSSQKPAPHSHNHTHTHTHAGLGNCLCTASVLPIRIWHFNCRM